MSTSVLITLIICVTIVIVSALNMIGEVIERKNKPKTFFEILGVNNKEDK